MGGIFIKWAHIAGHDCATGILHEESVFADWKPHHPIYFPPQGVINGHLKLGWEDESGHELQQAFCKPTHNEEQLPCVIQAPMCLCPTLASLSPL